MKIAYFDCFSGISGDMFIGALIDSGLDFQLLENELKKLNLAGYSLDIEKVNKNGITGTKFNVKITGNSQNRNFKDIKKLINSTNLDNDIKEKSIDIFTRIAEAEAKIHGTTIDKVHFHEVGAVDSIIDIVGSAIGIKFLGIDKIFSSKIHIGTGFVSSSHGKIPVPAPATLEILKGIPVYSKGIKSELTTPTGAAIITYFSSRFIDIPEMKISSIGYGAGTRDLEIPNMLRVLSGTLSDEVYLQDKIVKIETNIDDMNPEFYESIFEKLLSNGALDVYTTSIMMKKSRIGVLLSVLLNRENIDEILNTIFSETTTSGVRIEYIERKKLIREIKTVETEFGTFRVKINSTEKNIMNIAPEYEDCKSASLETGIPIKTIYDKVKATAESILKKSI